MYAGSLLSLQELAKRFIDQKDNNGSSLLKGAHVGSDRKPWESRSTKRRYALKYQKPRHRDSQQQRFARVTFPSMTESRLCGQLHSLGIQTCLKALSSQ